MFKFEKIEVKIIFSGARFLFLTIFPELLRQFGRS